MRNKKGLGCLGFLGFRDFRVLGFRGSGFRVQGSTGYIILSSDGLRVRVFTLQTSSIRSLGRGLQQGA